MNVTLILVPYDSGHRGQRMGAGPERLIEAGLARRLVDAGHDVVAETVEARSGWRAELTTGFELMRGVAERVGRVRAAGRFPLVLSGNCSVSVGVVAGLGARTAVIWLDAHGDYNTPETSVTGFLDGMALAVLTGRCWAPMSGAVPGFEPVPESLVCLAGARDLDPLESTSLASSGILRLEADSIGRELGGVAGVIGSQADRLYLHLDLDVLDPSEGRVNGYAAPGGVTLHDLRAGVGDVASSGALQAATLSAYDPSADVDGRARAAAITLAEEIVGTAARQSALR